MAFNWTCPHCSTKTTINSGDYKIASQSLTIENSEGNRNLETKWIGKNLI